MTKYTTLIHGIKVAYQEWGRSNPRKVIALHGWLDNSNTFNYLGPYLAERGYHVVAIDNVGHGHSDHLGVGGSYTMSVILVSAVRQVMDALEWKQSHLVGHSMGANVGLMYTASHQDRIDKLVMLEGIGPLVKPADQTPKYVRTAIDTEFIIAKKSSKSKWYPTFREAIEARLTAVKAYPGEQFICRGSVSAIVARAVRFEDNREEDPVNESDGPVQFRHDPKLLYPSPVYHTIEQAKAYLEAVTCKTQIILGEKGFPTKSYPEFEERMKILADKGILSLEVLPGSHHLHLDEEHAPKTAETVYNFLKE